MEPQEQQKKEIIIIKRALLVEDYVPCQKTMTYYLNELGYQVDLTAESLTASQKIQSKIYDLIISDINLHGSLLGKNVIQMVRESEFNAGTPLIVWTAYANRNDEEKYLAWGADGALIKWCSCKVLENAIQQCFLMSRYERSFVYKFKEFQKKFQINCPTEYPEKARIILREAIRIIEEHHVWMSF